MQVGSIFSALIFIVFNLNVANAQWLCREASSSRSGQTITACGVGQSQNLDEARIKSRESAVEEFKRLCQLSSDCFDFDYTVIPKRTDCEVKEGKQNCYRALDFEISDRRKKAISVDVDEMERQLRQSQAEVQQIQTQIEVVRQIKQSEQDHSDKKKELAALESTLNKKEADELKLLDMTSKETVESGSYRYLHQAYRNSVKVAFHYWVSKLTSDSESDIMWLAAYERRPLPWLGIQVYGGFGRGHLENQQNTDSDVPTLGPRNTTQSFNGSVVYADVGLAALIYSGWRGTYLKADVGQVNGKKETYLVAYNGSGVGSPVKTTNAFSSNYVGAHLGFDTRDDKKGWGVFFEVGARKLSGASTPGFMGSVGVNYGF